MINPLVKGRCGDCQMEYYLSSAESHVCPIQVAFDTQPWKASCEHCETRYFPRDGHSCPVLGPWSRYTGPLIVVVPLLVLVSWSLWLPIFRGAGEAEPFSDQSWGQVTGAGWSDGERDCELGLVKGTSLDDSQFEHLSETEAYAAHYELGWDWCRGERRAYEDGRADGAADCLGGWSFHGLAYDENYYEPYANTYEDGYGDGYGSRDCYRE